VNADGFGGGHISDRSLSISVSGIALHGRCGVSDEERAVGQTLVVDVRLEPASCPGAETDHLEGTVNYSHVVDLVRGIVEGGEFHLLERLATVIADALWDEADLVRVQVGVAKLAPPVSIAVDAARVEVVRAR
jgi:7,8-dihydroneopterin aldolase/epimerase/oxygenase